MLQKILAYFRESRAELSRVTWPTREQVLEGTQTVVVFVTALTLLIWGMDFIFHKGMGLILR